MTTRLRLSLAWFRKDLSISQRTGKVSKSKSGESERPLMELLSSSEGLDVNKAHLRSTPFYAAALEDGSELTFLGAVDSHVDLETRYKFTNYEGPIEKEILQQMPPDGKATVSEDVTPLKLAETRMASSILKEPEDHLDNESYEGPHESFKYNSLPTNSKMIRLVCSGAQHEEGVISSLEMHTFDIDAPPTFHALSYVWNSPQRDVSTTCNGQKLMVTESLALALK